MILKKKHIFLISLLAAIILFCSLEIKFLTAYPATQSLDNSFKILSKVIYLIKDEYVEEPEPSKIMKGAFQSLAGSLDPLSSYLDKETAEKYKRTKESPYNYKETGIVLFKPYESFPRIVGILEHSPSEEMGLKVGDYISSIDGRSTLPMSMLEANLSLKEEEEKPVKIKLLRPGKNNEIEIPRQTLRETPFSLSSAEGTSGILRIHSFGPSLADNIKEKIVPQLRSKKNPLVLDLRNSYEGDIEGARKFINLFLQTESLGFLQKKGQKVTTLSCLEKAVLEHLPLLIWTNQATIGPSELVAGALKKYKSAKIIGTKTLGLIGRQTLVPLEDGSALVLTSGIFSFSPEETVWEKGINPDIPLDPEDSDTKIYLKKSLESLSRQ